MIPNLSYYTSNRVIECQHNFTWGEKGSDGVIYIGVVPNWKAENKYDKSVVIEYNPNKVDPFLYSELAWLKNFSKHNIRLMSCDFAVDYDVQYDTVRMLKRDKRESFAIFGRSGVETRYLGKMGHGHVKLYNKAIEQKLTDVDWTRFEITNKKINSLSATLEEFNNLIKIPDLYIISEQIDIECSLLNDTMRLAFESILENIDRLYIIKNYRTRKKYEALLSTLLLPMPVDKKMMYKSYLEFCNKFNQSSNLTCVHTDYKEMFYDQYKFRLT